ncbi:hypothetical protein Tcan_11989 [Toxocara canis]|uniref:Uncharacterized protein n=1 Tax=Toxocara canis TaxID=6265 RepID=A0A0B2UVD5_TOXCA|nr:hypothetical protein Tcan_11989 [Toxocara canis]
MCTYHIRLGLTLRSYAVSGRLCWRQCSSIASSSDPAHSSVQATANSYNYDATSLRLSANWLSSIGGKLERTKEAIKFAAHCDRVGSVEALRAVVELLKGDTQVAKAHPHRVLYFSIHLALILDELDVAKELFELAPTGVHVLATSLRVQLLSRLGRLNDALMQLEYVLNEDVPRFDVKRKIADEALDELCAAIKVKPNSVIEMRRFRYLQRLLTKYDRRTKCTINELLNAALFDSFREQQEEHKEKLEEATIEKIIKVWLESQPLAEMREPVQRVVLSRRLCCGYEYREWFWPGLIG